MTLEPNPPGGQRDRESPDVDVEAGVSDPSPLENVLSDLPPPPIQTS